MNKKSKAIIIAVSSIIFLVTVLGVLYWGLQPVQTQNVTLEKLNKKLGKRYCMPSELPFEGDVECEIVYVLGSMGVVLTRFEISPKRSTGYTIKLYDENRDIRIYTGDWAGINAEALERYLIENYNEQKIQYLFDETDTKKILLIQFKIDGEIYYLSATYNEDVSSQTLKSDMEYILNQMIK